MIDGSLKFMQLPRLSRPIPSHQKVALHELLSVMTYGEEIARRGAYLQAKMATAPTARKFLLQQARHEKFHALVFGRAAEMVKPDGHQDLAPIPPVLKAWSKQIETSIARGDLAESLLIQQIFLEGLAHIVMYKADAELAGHGYVDSQQFLKLQRYILQQEAEHHAFGVQQLRRVLTNDAVTQRRLRQVSASLLNQTGELIDSLSETCGALDVTDLDYAKAMQSKFFNDVPGLSS